MVTREEMTQELMEALVALPNTADGIAAKFLAEGITGTPQDSCDCPLAAYASRETGYSASVGPNNMFVSHRGPESKWTVSTFDIPLSEPLSEFVMRFDRGNWPELIIIDEDEI